jgi:hypothetical protein
MHHFAGGALAPGSRATVGAGVGAVGDTIGSISIGLPAVHTRQANLEQVGDDADLAFRVVVDDERVGRPGISFSAPAQ